MSILVKGMKMPKVCADCPFWETRYDPGYYNYEHCKALGRIFNECRRDISPFEEKLDDCPLIKIPTPHGNLIDEGDIASGYYYEDNVKPIIEAEE